MPLTGPQPLNHHTSPDRSSCTAPHHMENELRVGPRGVLNCLPRVVLLDLVLQVCTNVSCPSGCAKLVVTLQGAQRFGCLRSS